LYDMFGRIFSMNKPIVIIGVVVLIVGVVLIAVGAVGVLRGLTVVTTFSQPQSGEHVSTELMLNTTSGIAVTSAAANGGLIPAQDLNLVNSTNFGQYALTPHSNVAGTLTYTNLTGDYYVAFASSQPSSKIVATPLHGGTMASSPLVLGGFAVIIAGIVVAVIGVRMNRKSKREKREEEERRNSNMQNPAPR
jgi:hypothetical protein